MTEVDLHKLSDVSTREHSFKGNKNRIIPPRRFKTSKQILLDEVKYLSTKKLEYDTPTYTSISAPPSLKPSKKYCDITGLPSSYRAPTNGLRFHNLEVYKVVIKNMSPNLDQEYLQLRGDNVVLK